MRSLGILFLVGMALTARAAPAPQPIACAAGQTTWLSGTGSARMPLLVYWHGRAVGGGSVNAAGRWAIPLNVGHERPGLYLVEVRSRNDRALIGAFQCAVGVVVPPAPPTAAPLPTPSGAAPITVTDCPADHQVKGNIVDRGPNIGEKIYHVPGDNGYAQTKPERCFATAADAQAAGFRAAQ